MFNVPGRGERGGEEGGFAVSESHEGVAETPVVPRVAARVLGQHTEWSVCVCVFKKPIYTVLQTTEANLFLFLMEMCKCHTIPKGKARASSQPALCKFFAIL